MIRKLTTLLALALAVPCAAFAQLDSSLVSISPSATEVSEHIPPLPLRITAYGFQGVSSTTYTARFQVTPEPALVVAVGAEITSMSYDSGQSFLDVTVSYSGETVLTGPSFELPSSSFFLFLDEGADPTVQVHRTAASGNKSDARCYGPGADLDRFDEEDGDFGDDDGLADPSPPASEDEGAGFPETARGSYASTNTFLWCSVRPDGEVKFEIAAPQDKVGRYTLFLPDSFLASVRSENVSTIQASRLAVFTLGNQISIDLSDVGSGVLAEATVPFEDGRVRVDDTSVTAVATAFERRAALRAAATAATSIGRKQLSITARLPLSISPDDAVQKRADTSVEIFGFVDDPALVGELVDIIRIDVNGCVDLETSVAAAGGIGIRAFTGTVISRTPVQSDASYQATLPSSSVFTNNSKKSEVTAKISGDVTRESRQVSLSKKSRGNRQ